jgi:hypothetical protein
MLYDTPDQDPYNDMDLDALLVTKSGAIEDMDFEEAKIIDSVIYQRRECEKTSHKKIKGNLMSQITSVYNEYLKRCAAVRKEAESREAPIREKTDRAFQEFQLRHIKELIVIEKQRSLEVIRAMSRVVPCQQDYVIQAKRMARMGNYEGSIAARQRAEDVHREEQKSRRAKIDAKFDAIRKSALSRQKADLAILTDKFRNSLAAIHATEQVALEAALKRMMVSVANLRKNAISSVVKDEAVRGKPPHQIIREISKFVSETFGEISGFELNGGTYVRPRTASARRRPGRCSSFSLSPRGLTLCED